jgi:hypothetical protein
VHRIEDVAIRPAALAHEPDEQISGLNLDAVDDPVADQPLEAGTGGGHRGSVEVGPVADPAQDVVGGRAFDVDGEGGFGHAVTAATTAWATNAAR